MKKFILPICFFLLFLSLPFHSDAQSSTDCWPTHMTRQYAECTPPHTKCLKECSYLDTTPKRKVCFDECDSVTKLCTDKAVADYRTCINSSKKLATPQAAEKSELKESQSVNCWQEHMAADGCTPQYAACVRGCPKDASSAQRACEDACSKESRACRDESLANYRACVNAQQNGQQKSETKKLQPYPEQLEQFLEDVKQGQIAIDQCPPPRIPSENTCVSDALSQFEIPSFLTDVALQPGFTDPIVLDDSSNIQIIALPDTVKFAPDYMMNTISSNFDYQKVFEVFERETLQNVPSLELSPAYSSDIKTPHQQFSLVDRTGETAVTIPSKGETSNIPSSGRWESVSNLIRLDEDVRGVGRTEGPSVEKIAKILLDSNAKVTLVNRNNQSGMEISKGASVIVAGWTKGDTVEAAKDFVATLR